MDLTAATPDELARVLRGADAVVYAAGSSHDSTAQESVAIHRDVAIGCIDAAVRARVPHFAMFSAHRVDEDFGGQATLTYLRAKRTADAHLRSQTDLRWTIVRPDALTDDEPTGHVQAGDRVPHGELPRADLAAVVVAAITSSGGNAQFEVGRLRPAVPGAARRRRSWLLRRAPRRDGRLPGPLTPARPG